MTRRFQSTLLLMAAVGLAVLGTILFSSGNTQAHANLLRASPAPGSEIAQAPNRVVLWFSEPLVPALSSMDLLDQDGRKVALGQVYVSPTEPTALVAELPEVPKGAYTVVWRNTSTVDGHSVRGSFTFFYGVPATPEAQPAQHVPFLQNAADPWVRWVAFLSMAVLAGGLLFEFVVAVPLLASQGSEQVVGAARQMSRTAVIGLSVAAAAALLASVVQLVLQARAIGDSSIVDAAGTVLTGTRWGQLWMLRTGLLAAAALVVMTRLLRRRAGESASDAAEADEDSDSEDIFLTETFAGPLAMLIALAALPVTSLMGHSAAVPPDIRFPAVLSDVLHIISTAAWVGGLVYLALALPALIRVLRETEGPDLLARLIDRFSMVALLASGALVITGLFSGWIHVTRPGAVDSPYGWALVAKVVVVGVLLSIAAVNSYVLRPRLRADERAAPSLRRLVIVEVVAASLVILGAGWLASLEPARSYAARLEAENGRQLTFKTDTDSGRIAVSISPASMGPNRVTIGVQNRRGEPVLNATDVRARLVYREQDLGASFVSTADTGGGVWVADGLEMNVAGSWQVEVVVVRPDAFDARAAFAFEAGSTNLASETGRPTRTVTFVLFGIEVGLLGLLGIAVAAPRWRRDRRTATLVGAPGLGFVVVGAVLAAVMYVSSSDASAAVNPVLPTEDSIARGRATFSQNCAVCHGDTGTGNGPQAPSLPVRPADLTVHVPLHPDMTLFRFIREGFPSQGMPPFKDRFSENEIWDLVNYLRELAEAR